MTAAGTGARLAKMRCHPTCAVNARLSPHTLSRLLASLDAARFQLVSGGPDGLLDTADDIVGLQRWYQFTDFKHFTSRCHIGLIEGGVCNSENVETLRRFREQCDILVSVGECSVWGGLPAMRNGIPLGECLEEAYLNSATSEAGASVIPYHEDLPKILDRIYACNEIVKIDYYIPGCPPDANHIWKALKNILWGEEYSILYSEFKYD